MRLRELGWGLFLAGLPWAHLLFRPSLDPWHGQAVWAQGWGLCLVSLWIWQGGTPIWNPALAAWCLWVGISWLVQWNLLIITQHLYPLPLAMGLLHFLCLLGFYLAATATWNYRLLQHLLRWMARSAVVVLLYCGLQLLNLDQFFSNLDPQIFRDEVVGTIGNPSHLAAQLACCLPLFLLQPQLRWKVWVCLTIGLLLVLKSFAGMLSAWIAVAVFLWTRPSNRRETAVFLLLGLCVATFLYYRTDWLNPHGRWEAWGEFWRIFERRPITGFGQGFIMELSREIPNTSRIFQWRHVHNEYLQLAIEQGVVGVACAGWFLYGLVHATRRAVASPERTSLLAMLLAFLVNAMLNYPAHLWQVGIYGLVAVCGLQVLARDTARTLP